MLFFMFLTVKDINLQLSELDTNDSSMIMEQKLALQLLIDFENYLDDKLWNINDKRWRLFISFYKFVSVFKLYEKSMKTGNAVLMEALENNFCGVFLLLDKSNYVEIYCHKLKKIPSSEL